MGTHPCVISVKSALQPFNGCEPTYIRDVCHAACCRSSSAPDGTNITIAPSEAAGIRAHGATVRRTGGVLRIAANPQTRLCPFQTAEHLCALHAQPERPFGCVTSPWTLSTGGVLIIRNRYRLLKCYNDGRRLPAYLAFEASAAPLFPPEEWARIKARLQQATRCTPNFGAAMDAAAYRRLREATVRPRK